MSESKKKDEVQLKKSQDSDLLNREIYGLILNEVSMDYILEKYQNKGYTVREIQDSISKNRVFVQKQRDRTLFLKTLLFNFRQIMLSFLFGFFSFPLINLMLYFADIDIFIILIVNIFMILFSQVVLRFFAEYFILNDVSKKSTLFYELTRIVSIILVIVSLYFGLKLLLVLSVILVYSISGTIMLLDSAKNSKLKLKHVLNRHFLAVVGGIGIFLAGVVFLRFDFVSNNSYYLDGFIELFVFILGLALISFFLSLVNHQSRGTFLKKYDFFLFCKTYKNKFVKNISYKINSAKILLFFSDGLILFIKVLFVSTFSLFLFFKFSGIYSQQESIFYVVLVLSVAAIFSIFASAITNRTSKYTSILPVIIFGTVLLSILPLILVKNFNLTSAILSTILFILGMGIIEVGRGIYINQTFDDVEKTKYYDAVPFISFLISLIVTLVVAIFLGFSNFELIYKMMFLTIVLGIVPLYIIIEILNSASKKS